MIHMFISKGQIKVKLNLSETVDKKLGEIKFTLSFLNFFSYEKKIY